MTIEITTRWRYAHGFGARKPYFDGLAAGRAIATHCSGCGKTRSPPQLACCGAITWVELAGTGALRVVTTGPIPWGLIALDGADTLALGRLSEPMMAGRRVRLALDPGAEPGSHPAAAVWYVPA